MSGLHLHLLVNHVPVIGAVFAVAMLLASSFYATEVLRRIALVVLMVVALAAAAAKFTGEPAEDGVRGLPGVTRTAIHEHEEIADKAFIAAILVGIVAVVVLVRSQRTTIATSSFVVVLIGAVAVSALMGYTGLLGGQVRHTEIRAGATAAEALMIEPPRTPRPTPDAK